MSVRSIQVVLLGGARRVTLAEHIAKICETGGLAVEFISVERDSSFYPIAALGQTIVGPTFKSESFREYLQNLLKDLDAPVPIACMDMAVHSLATLSGKQFGRAIVVGPSEEGARIAGDKALTASFCTAMEIAHPRRHFDKRSIAGRVIAKPREGFGGKGIILAEGSSDLDDAIFDTHVVQDFIPGKETTHDVYINADGGIFVGSRDRLAVIDGEVDHCLVRQPTIAETEIIKNIANSGLFRGPITVQTIHDTNRPFLIEINSRLGGGVTASIAAGVPIIEQLISDSVGATIPLRQFRPLEMKRARRDFYRFLD